MQMGRTYTHERFMDVMFKVLFSHLYGEIYQVKVAWYNKSGDDLNVVTKHAVPRHHKFILVK